jgi:hypothetical protein
VSLPYASVGHDQESMVERDLIVVSRPILCNSLCPLGFLIYTTLLIKKKKIVVSFELCPIVLSHVEFIPNLDGCVF